jgi:serine/threonine protein kinase
VLDIKKPLGKGANGEVFLGIDLNTQKSVAVKQISLAQKKDRNLQLIQNEILVMKKIKNPNVV